MPPLPVRPNSLCLVCASATRIPLQSHRRLPRIQVANRAGGHKKKKKTALDSLDVPKILQIRRSFVPYEAFAAIRTQLEKLRGELEQPEFLQSLQLSRDDFDREWLTFERSISLGIKKALPEYEDLVNTGMRGKRPLESKLRYLFYAQTFGSRFTAAELENQKDVADLRYPSEWYPATREIPRTVHMHVGPTNSGKTYHALKRLEEAKTGIYLGPLRLLAHEVYTRLNAKGKPCALVTGEEQRMPDVDRVTMFSCTVEMAPLNSSFEVAVIDEIQMINHQDRGWAWTQAFLGLQANEIHLCGEARTVPIIRELCALIGDKIHIHEYNRLTPLQVTPRSLKGNLNALEKGDCIVAFSILGIHALRRNIEKRTGKKCAIVYGSLPPETRAQQARLFNDPDNDYDFLVASDAIGMGLNLAIKRVIFESTMKNNGVNFVPLEISDLKQIAGRAGRYKTAHQAITKDTESAAIAPPTDPTIGLDDKKPEENKEKEPQTVGWVTTLSSEDHAHLKFGMNREPEQIKTAGLFPPSLVVERFANYFPPGTPFSYIMLRLHDISEIHPRFHLCALKDQLAIADAIHPVTNLSIQDRTVICAAPINMKDEGERNFLRTLAECIANGHSGSILDLKNLPLDSMDDVPSSNRAYLYSLERLHKMLVCYLWLSYRFPNVFITRTLANYTKKLVEDKIENTLTQFSFTKQSMEKIRLSRAQARKELGKQSKGADTQQMGSSNKSAPLEISEGEGDIVDDTRALAEARPSSNDPRDGMMTGSRSRNYMGRSTKLSNDVADLLKDGPSDTSKSAAIAH